MTEIDLIAKQKQQESLWKKTGQTFPQMPQTLSFTAYKSAHLSKMWLPSCHFPAIGSKRQCNKAFKKISQLQVQDYLFQVLLHLEGFCQSLKYFNIKGILQRSAESPHAFCLKIQSGVTLFRPLLDQVISVKKHILAAMANSQFAVWLRTNADTKKETSTKALSDKFFTHSDAHAPLFSRCAGFKYLQPTVPGLIFKRKTPKPVLKVKTGKICSLKVSQ